MTCVRIGGKHRFPTSHEKNIHHCYGRETNVVVVVVVVVVAAAAAVVDYSVVTAAGATTLP